MRDFGLSLGGVDAFSSVRLSSILSWICCVLKTINSSEYCLKVSSFCWKLSTPETGMVFGNRPIGEVYFELDYDESNPRIDRLCIKN